MTETTHGEMYERAYFEVQDILDEVLGTEEEDGSGGGIAADVALLADRLKAAEAENQQLHSWQGLMSILDEHYSGDHGNRIWALLHAVNDERSSRQAWAAEAERLQADLDEIMRPAIWDLPHAYRNNGSGEHGTPGDCRTCGRPDFDDLHEPPEPPKITVCACISDDQASQLGPGFTRPVCAVHEQKDASDA